MLILVINLNFKKNIKLNCRIKVEWKLSKYFKLINFILLNLLLLRSFLNESNIRQKARQPVRFSKSS